MTHLLSLIGITLLCAAWILFQLWLKRVDPERGNYQPGCGACGSSNSCGPGGCTTESRATETTIDLVNTGLGTSSGEAECKEKRSL